jgi:hypothetical protein
MKYYMRPDDKPNLYCSDDGFTLFQCGSCGEKPEFHGWICNEPELIKVSRKKAEEMLEFLECL